MTNEAYGNFLIECAKEKQLNKYAYYLLRKKVPANIVIEKETAEGIVGETIAVVLETRRKNKKTFDDSQGEGYLINSVRNAALKMVESYYTDKRWSKTMILHDLGNTNRARESSFGDKSSEYFWDTISYEVQKQKQSEDAVIVSLDTLLKVRPNLQNWDKTKKQFALKVFDTIFSKERSEDIRDFNSKTGLSEHEVKKGRVELGRFFKREGLELEDLLPLVA